MYRTKTLFLNPIIALIGILVFITLLVNPSLWTSTAGANNRFQDITPSDPISTNHTDYSPLTSIQLASTKDIFPKKIIYLTFDDGPSKLTEQVLHILKQRNIQSTFFVLGNQATRYPEDLKDMVKAGHTIGNHTFNHEYKQLYSNFTEFWSQIKQTEEIIRHITGTRTSLVRAPGGTYNHFDASYFLWMKEAGYQVFDWDVDSGDSMRRGVPASEIIHNSTPSKPKDQLILLMHDGSGHDQTVKALPHIIDYYKNLGYEFRTLTPKVQPVQFPVHPGKIASSSSLPDGAWVASHVIPNARLFTGESPLHVVVGGKAFEVEAGNYELSQDQYKVPLRTMAERLGAQVQWDSNTKITKVCWGTRTLIINNNQQNIVRQLESGEVTESIPLSVEVRGERIWVPLRPLLEQLGHPIISVNTEQTREQITAI
ncbi:peptidoglycan/xylan/chitin deacetylase (PgdA/CDA1 family) [Paenibacillus shirakamiensis]|uniref:Peptidoglycan/xylan/chitin deacetylase (PgdA/CDA1 family) n=1 Tax=Paenibacillus shirakamiensis TaxID=1265935 RepID=A0ABS4JJ46_9BACL|nr:polysaccharide deacetylase [Paenibacillus shirakamiensis]MBP2001725.1 peptidoglycan/xylan/chitin deacetylase (PgdA/CDA1 family) [Paenibacillus shirakamiensis]